MPNNATLTPEVGFGINSRDRRTLMHIFQHPLTHNLTLREVTGLIDSIGTVEMKHNGDAILRVGDEQVSIKRQQHKDLAADDIVTLRHFLQRVGWVPETPQLDDTVPVASDVIIIIDHAQANIHAIISQDEVVGAEKLVKSQELHRALHHVDRKQHDSDREEKYPSDVLFFEEIAKSLLEGRIVIIGHGKGQSNEAKHLSEYLLSHHRDIYARVVDEIVADLPHLTVPQLLELGQRALHQGGAQPIGKPGAL